MNAGWMVKCWLWLAGVNGCLLRKMNVCVNKLLLKQAWAPARWQKSAVWRIFLRFLELRSSEKGLECVSANEGSWLGTSYPPVGFGRLSFGRIIFSHNLKHFNFWWHSWLTAILSCAHQSGDKRACLQDLWVFCLQCMGAFCLGSSLGSQLGSSSSLWWNQDPFSSAPFSFCFWCNSLSVKILKLTVLSACDEF